jgi:hypothetical protein
MILKRPMFRRGGSSGEGITSGLAPRQNFDRGKLAQVQDQLRMLDVLAPAPKPRGSRAFNDFLINWGLNLGSTPPQGGLLSTAAATAKGPFGQFQQQKMYEGTSSDAAASERRSTVASLLKGLNDEQLSALMKKVRAGVEAGYYPNEKEGIIRQLQKEEYGVREEPGEAMEATKQKIWDTHRDSLEFKTRPVAANILAEHEAKLIHDDYSEELRPQFDLDQSYIDPMHAGNIEEDGSIKLNNIGKNARDSGAVSYRPGKLYFNISDKSFYRLGPDGLTFTIVDIADFEK